MKNYTVLFLALGVLGLIFWGNNLLPQSLRNQALQALQNQPKATLEIALGNELRRYPDIEFKEGETALDLTRKAVEVESKGEGEMTFVTSVHGQKADDAKKEFWSFWVNGKMAEVGAGTYKLQAGDVITWKIQTY